MPMINTPAGPMRIDPEWLHLNIFGKITNLCILLNKEEIPPAEFRIRIREIFRYASDEELQEYAANYLEVGGKS